MKTHISVFTGKMLVVKFRCVQIWNSNSI